MDSGR